MGWVKQKLMNNLSTIKGIKLGLWGFRPMELMGGECELGSEIHLGQKAHFFEHQIRIHRECWKLSPRLAEEIRRRHHVRTKPAQAQERVTFIIGDDESPSVARVNHCESSGQSYSPSLESVFSGFLLKGSLKVWPVRMDWRVRMSWGLRFKGGLKGLTAVWEEGWRCEDVEVMGDGAWRLGAD